MSNARKAYDLEDPDSPKWALHRKHFFILSSAGKPIFSRFGDESRLAPLAGVLQALVSFVSDSGDSIRYARAGSHFAVFVAHGPIYLVAVSSGGDTVPYLTRQLSCMHSQILSILTSKVEDVFARNASYDLRSLLGGTDRVLRSLIHSSSREPSMLLQAVPCLRMASAPRAELGKLLSASRPPSLLFGLVLAKGFLVQLWRPKRTRLQPADLLLVMNAVNSSNTFREDESWLPICLPQFNPRAFLYAHISFVAPDVCLVLLSASRDSFVELSMCRQQIIDGLHSKQELRAALDASVQVPQCCIDEPGVPEIRHYMFRLATLEQCTSPHSGHPSSPESPYRNHSSLKHLFQRYQLVHSRVHASEKPLREYFQASNTEAIFVWCNSDFELYVALGPLVTKPMAVAACHKLLRWLRTEEKNLFLFNPACD